MQTKKKPSGMILVLSAPSGAGKTTLCKKLAKRNPNLYFSTSYTTRQPRPGEKEARDYFFISREEFLKKQEEGFFAESAKVHGDLYGTPRKTLDEAIKRGEDIVLTIDVQGKEQIKRKYPQSISIFIESPTFEDLEERLEQRKTESEAAIFVRLSRAKQEIEQSKSYDYKITNRKIDEALKELEERIALEKSKLK